MKKCFLKCIATMIALATTYAISAAPTDNNNLNNTKSALQSQAANAQNATNSLINWLNANLVTGTPPQFLQSLKGNWQTILANHDLNDLNWLLTQKFTLALLAGADIGDDSDMVPTTLMPSKELQSQVGHFNIGSLLSTTTIKPKSDEEKNAQILLQFVSGLNNAVSGLPKTIVTRGLGPVNDFQNQFGTYLAQQSVGLNVLYGLLNERLVKKGLGSQLGGPQQDMSPLALDQYMATRRLNVNDPNGWLSQLSNATPAQVAKEQLMLMSEMRYEMYLTRRSLEQMSMLMAVQQLQLNNADAAKLQQLKSDIMSASTSTVLGN